MRRSTFKNSKVKDNKLVQIEEEMKFKVDKEEKIKFDKIYKEQVGEAATQSYFTRLLAFNQPRYNIFIGILMSIMQGALMPVFGGVMAKMLFVLMNVYDLVAMRTEANKWCGLMLAFAFIALLTGFGQKFSFGVIGENVTSNIRRTLYRKIITKH